MFTRRTDDLPERIVAALAGVSKEDEFIAAVKTALKPNATIPFLWLVCTKRDLLVCNTHRTRGLYKKSTWSEINAIRRIGESSGAIHIEVIYQGLDQDDDLYPLGPEISRAMADAFIDCCCNDYKPTHQG